MTDIKQPQVSKVSNELELIEDLEIINLNYDLWRLTLTMTVPKFKKMVYVTFENVLGFRVLDEGDLLEFWNLSKKPTGFIWIVESGGWFDLEKTRSGFVSGHQKENQEYLIIGINECVSVLSHKIPIIQIIN